MKEYSLQELIKGLDIGKWTSRDLVDMYLERIKQIDQSGPKLNAMAEINPEVYEIADSLDLERNTIGKRGLLHGIPIVIKDNINTYDFMHTSASSIALSDLFAPNDAFVVKKLREAGMIILGKTNLSEFAYFMSFDDMPSGYGSRFGQVKSPYNEKIDPLGSSTGSAVAVASNMIPVSIGTETNGSLTAPAQNNSIVTIKPTLGLVSRTGIIPISHKQDTAGPMARTVADCAILLDVIYGKDENDLKTYHLSEKKYNFSETYNQSTSNLNIGILRFSNTKYTDEELKILEEAETVLKNKVKSIKHISMKHEEFSYTSLIYEFKVDLNKYLSSVRSHTNIHTLKDLIEFNKLDPERRLKYGQSIFEASEKTSGTLKEPEYIDARKDVLLKAKKLTETMIENDLDVVIMTRRTSHGPIAGNPCVCVPAKALIDTTPRSLFFVGKNFDDDLCLQVAYQYEQATKKRIPPTF